MTDDEVLTRLDAQLTTSHPRRTDWAIGALALLLLTAGVGVIAGALVAAWQLAEYAITGLHTLLHP